MHKNLVKLDNTEYLLYAFLHIDCTWPLSKKKELKLGILILTSCNTGKADNSWKLNVFSCNLFDYSNHFLDNC